MNDTGVSPTPGETPATDPARASVAPAEQQVSELKARVEELEHQLWVERDRAIGLEAQLDAAPGNAARVEKILDDFHASKAYRTTRAVTLPFRAARKVVRVATGWRP